MHDTLLHTECQELVSREITSKPLQTEIPFHIKLNNLLEKYLGEDEFYPPIDIEIDQIDLKKKD
jgi:hypothetical protein